MSDSVLDWFKRVVDNTPMPKRRFTVLRCMYDYLDDDQVKRKTQAELAKEVGVPMHQFRDDIDKLIQYGLLKKTHKHKKYFKCNNLEYGMYSDIVEDMNDFENILCWYIINVPRR